MPEENGVKYLRTEGKKIFAKVLYLVKLSFRWGIKNYNQYGRTGSIVPEPCKNLLDPVLNWKLPV